MGMNFCLIIWPLTYNEYIFSKEIWDFLSRARIAFPVCQKNSWLLEYTSPNRSLILGSISPRLIDAGSYQANNICESSSTAQSVLCLVVSDAESVMCEVKHHYPDSKVHGANMGPTWVLSSPGGPRVGPTNLAIWVDTLTGYINVQWWVNGCGCGLKWATM